MEVLKEVFFPKNVEEILELKDKYREDAVLVGGSTSLGLKQHPLKSFMIDLNHAGISTIKEEDKTRFRIGAAAPVNRLMYNKRLNLVYKNFFYDACRNLSSCTLRNMITVGGNVCFSLPWSDLPPVFFALGAKFVLKSKGGGKRVLSPEKFFKKHPSLILENNEVLIELIIPKPKKNQKFLFLKFAQTENDYAIVNIAISYILEDDRITDIHSALGGMYNPAIGLKTIDDFLLGKPVHANHGNQVKELLNSLPTPLKDSRFSQEYRKKVAINLVLDMVNRMGDE